MPRLRQIGRDDAHPFGQLMYSMLFGDRDPVAEPGTASGTPGNWWTVFALVPDAFDHTTAGFQFYRDPKRALDPMLRELGQTRAGFNVGSQFVFSQHCKAMRDAGFTDDQVAAIPAWSVADCWSPAERAVLAYTDCLTLQFGRVPDSLFDELQRHLSDEEILEFTYVTCTYAMHATMSKALRLEYDDVDERVVEVADPSGRMAGLDVMAAVDDPALSDDVDGG
ncbi:MAG TPA: carboxymuconolactone decarboxylase family protein [Ilumatobacteraceae bacterium]|nr:carboxymuconolactone decarboxylase family protein [Ilumatobacteraceae bacterium]